ncbi:MAG: hypothetical protein DCC55_35185, partial [Chloroflexi bacterium]
MSGLGVLVLAWLWLTGAAAQAATVTVNLCASTGALSLPNSVNVPIWGFVDSGGGPCTPGQANSLPGPSLRAAAGDTVIINLTNALNTPTSIVIPGQLLTASGGAPGPFTQEAPANGGTVTYSFTATPGAFLYESGSDFDIQVAMGLYGALIVESATPGQAYTQPTSAFTNEAVLVLSEIDPNLNANPSGFNMLDYKPVYWLLNGKVYPDTAPVATAAGNTLLLRYLNAGFDNFSMTILGLHQRVIAKNSFELTNPFYAVAETIPAGETLDAVVAIPASPSTFSFPLYNRNMYVTNNGSGPGGMRTLIVEGAPPPPPPPPPPPSQPLIFVSSSSGGNVGGVAFADEDILAYNPNTNTWAMVFDGSDVGVGGGTDVNGFAFQTDGSILMTFDAPVNIAGIGTVDDSDIVRFTPTALGPTTSGSFSLFFDGSDVGLTTNDEDIDAFGFTPDGRLVVSTLGSFSVPGLSGTDEDLIVLNGGIFGPNTSGTWALYFDGSDVALTAGPEDIWGVSIDSATNQIYLTTQGNFSVPGATGTGADIFICTPSSLGASTSCAFSAFWTGSAFGFGGQVIDGLDIGTPPIVFAAAVPAPQSGDEAETEAGSEEDDPTNGDAEDDEAGAEEEAEQS